MWKKGIRKQKYTYEEVLSLFRKRGCELLSTEYINNNSPLKYRCSCGNEAWTRLRTFNQGKLCRQCRTDRAQRTNRKNHGGNLYFQTEQFKKKRKSTVYHKYGVQSIAQTDLVKSKRRKTCLQKYGATTYFNSDKGKIASRTSIRKRYGVNYISQVPEVREKRKKTLMSKYGTPYLACLSRSASKQSQKLFREIYRFLPQEHQKHTYYADLNHEFNIRFRGNFFKYDFVVTSLKVCLEYNGSRFHPKPEQQENEVGWFLFHPTVSVKEARDYEKTKRTALESRGYQVFYVWDFECKDTKKAVHRLINMILISLWRNVCQT